MNLNFDKIERFINTIMPAIFVIIFIVVGYWMLQKSQKSPLDKSKKICLEAYRIEISDIVVKNLWSRGTFNSIFKNNLIYEWYCAAKVKNILEVGDSVYKPSGTFDTYIYKKANPNSVIFVECDFDCDYWHKRYGDKYK